MSSNISYRTMVPVTASLRIKKRYKYWKLGAVERYHFYLKDNNTYPFQDLGDGFYYILIRSDKFSFGIAVMIIAIICYSLFTTTIGSFSFPLVLFIMVLGYGVFCLYGNVSHKELIINRYFGYILRIKGNEKIIVEEPISNIYIKLQRKYDTNLLPHFYLILGGFRLDDIRLTGFCMNDAPLRILGGGVAARMGINFFDVDNNSTIHKIYHYPNRSLLLPPDTDLSKFLTLHDLTDNDVKKARRDAHMKDNQEDASKVPESIVKHVLENYGQPSGKRRHPVMDDDKKLSKTLSTLRALDEQRQIKSGIVIASSHSTSKSKQKKKDSSHKTKKDK